MGFDKKMKNIYIFNTESLLVERHSLGKQLKRIAPQLKETEL